MVAVDALDAIIQFAKCSENCFMRDICHTGELYIILYVCVCVCVCVFKE